MTLQLYVLRQVTSAFLLALVTIGLMIVPAIAVQAIYKLGGVSVGLVVRYLPLVLAEILPFLVPIAFLLGVVATFGRLAADNEWTAIRMAGFHPLRMLVPGALVALPLSVGVHHVMSAVSPTLKYEQRNYQRLASRDAIKSLGYGRTEFQAGGFGVSAQRRTGNLFEEVIVEIPRTLDEDGAAAAEEGPDEERARSLLLVADAVQIDVLEDENALTARFRNARVLRGREEFENEHPTVRIALDDIVQVEPKKRDKPKYLTSAEIADLLTSGELSPEQRRAAVFEIHERRAGAATCLIFLLLGVPTGLLLRSGTHLGALSAAVAYAFLYYVLSMRLGSRLTEAGVIGPVAAAWATDGLYVAAAAVLLRKVLLR